MSASSKNVIAVIGATGQQGSSVVRALQARNEFRVRALTRDPSKHPGIADDVVAADLTRPETLSSALEGAHGVFAVTNFWEPGGADEIAQGEAVIRAAKSAGVRHFVWSTLPNVETISRGKYKVLHFTNKAKVDTAVAAAGFRHHTFVIAPFYYQNLQGNMAARRQPDGSIGWTLPIDPGARSIHMGDITELGDIVAGAFANPETAGGGQYLPLVGALLSFGDVVATLNSLGHAYKFNQVPREVFATFFRGADEIAEMFAYFQEYTYLGGNADAQIALANTVAGKQPTTLATWARSHMPRP